MTRSRCELAKSHLTPALSARTGGEEATTAGTLLGGRVEYSQAAHGFRSGIEPVFLAAAVPARAGETILEGGSGAGAALLCLAARVRGISGLGLERDPALARLARTNAQANAAAFGFVVGDVLGPPLRGDFDHVLANPPYHFGDGTQGDPARTLAKRADPGLVAAWAASLGTMLRHGGSLSLILSPARLAEALEGVASAGCGGVLLLPLWPRAGVPAKLLILRAVRGGRAALSLSAGLVLHRDDGAFTDEAEAILRGGAELRL